MPAWLVSCLECDPLLTCCRGRIRKEGHGRPEYRLLLGSINCEIARTKRTTGRGCRISFLSFLVVQETKAYLLEIHWRCTVSAPLVPAYLYI